MQKVILKDVVLDKIKDDPYLVADIATMLKYSTAYTLRLIREKDECLTQASILRILRRKLKMTDKQLLTEEATAA